MPNQPDQPNEPKAPVFPPPPRAGDRVALVAPASPPAPGQFQAAMRRLAALGYRPITYRDLGHRGDYLCGSDPERVGELNHAFADPDTRAVVALRGGYGAGRLLGDVDYDALAADPKPVVGYSDLTALHVAIARKTGLVTYHGSNGADGVSGGGKLDHASAERWRHAMQHGFSSGEDLFAGAPDRPAALAPGAAEGRLIGGNLAVLAALIGTPYSPLPEPCVLMLEDTGEPPYRIDRMLRQLLQSGLLGRAAAVLLGAFTNCTAQDDTTGPSAEQVLSEYFTPLGVPVLAGCPFGHDTPNFVLPHGARVGVDADRAAVTLVR